MKIKYTGKPGLVAGSGIGNFGLRSHIMSPLGMPYALLTTNHTPASGSPNSIRFNILDGLNERTQRKLEKFEKPEKRKHSKKSVYEEKLKKPKLHQKQ